MTSTGSRIDLLIQGESLKPYLSEYLLTGYRQDVLSIDSIRVLSDSAHCSFSIREHFVPPDGRYHLTLPAAFLVIAQTAIVWSHVCEGISHKTSEVWVTSIDVRCRRPVYQTEGLSLVLTLNNSRDLADGKLYDGSINVENGAFRGKASFYLPMKSSDSSVV